jgi:hypothetical protein
MTSPKFQPDRSGAKVPEPKKREAAPNPGRSGRGSDSLLDHLRQDRLTKAQAARIKRSDQS